MDNATELLNQLTDARGRQVVFLSHCLLNQNTRYLGGACQAGCGREIVDQCLLNGLGIVQLPCPEQLAWGGVLKRRLLPVYGARGRPHGRWRRLLLPVFLAYTRWRFRRLARAIAAQVADYLGAGFGVRAMVGVDGSPSCGVMTTLDIGQAAAGLAALERGSITVARVNAVIRQSAIGGRGLFIAALQAELARRHLVIPFLAHDLLAELDGRPATPRLGPAAPASPPSDRHGRP